MKELSKSYPMNTNMIGFTEDGFQKPLRPFTWNESTLSIGRVKGVKLGGHYEYATAGF